MPYLPLLKLDESMLIKPLLSLWSKAGLLNVLGVVKVLGFSSVLGASKAASLRVGGCLLPTPSGLGRDGGKDGGWNVIVCASCSILKLLLGVDGGCCDVEVVV